MILVAKQIKQIFSDEKPVFADEGNLRLLNAAISGSEVLVTAGLLLFMTIGLLEEPAIYCPMI